MSKRTLDPALFPPPPSPPRLSDMAMLELLHEDGDDATLFDELAKLGVLTTGQYKDGYWDPGRHATLLRNVLRRAGVSCESVHDLVVAEGVALAVDLGARTLRCIERTDSIESWARIDVIVFAANRTAELQGTARSFASVHIEGFSDECILGLSPAQWEHLSALPAFADRVKLREALPATTEVNEATWKKFTTKAQPLEPTPAADDPMWVDGAPAKPPPPDDELPASFVVGEIIVLRGGGVFRVMGMKSSTPDGEFLHDNPYVYTREPTATRSRWRAVTSRAGAERALAIATSVVTPTGDIEERNDAARTAFREGRISDLAALHANLAALAKSRKAFGDDKRHLESVRAWLACELSVATGRSKESILAQLAST